MKPKLLRLCTAGEMLGQQAATIPAHSSALADVCHSGLPGHASLEATA